MTTAVASNQVLADRLVRSHGWVTNVALIGAGAALVALLAQVTVPMWPVPITGQTLGVMLVGASLGAWRGAASMLTYMVAGLAGLPVFADFSGGIGTLASPSFGYIIGFVFAAALAGWCAQRRWDRHPFTSIGLFLAASLMPFVFGVPYMWFILAQAGTPMNLGLALDYGFTPFIIGGVVKWLIAAAALPLCWRGVRALEKRDERR